MIIDLVENITITQSSGSACCTTSCFDACDAVWELDGKTVVNAKLIFENDVNLEKLKIYLIF